ncbi:MAG: succinylglutamate desuccinylase/aspartoacylase family protein [Silvanigrellaceae bacterium]|nr:succinylglutamate desuccinylase/aspartoacylase family protein [Silvanigrellaceae bacterium]
MVIAPVKGKINIKYILCLLVLICFNNTYAINIIEKNKISPVIFENINIPLSLLNISGIPFTSFHVLNDIQRARSQKQIMDLCQRVDSTYKKLNWGKSPCISVPWKYDYVSENGNPLIYWDFISDSLDEDQKKNITVVLGGVHPDELTPIHLAFQFAEALQKNPELYANSHVIVAPLVNPDGFFTNPPKRTNANGVDLNRNFPTATWNKYAYQVWLKSKQKDRRKFPGYFANSEQGTRFQADLLEKFHPDKVISIHAPLAFLDLDYEIPQLLSIRKLTDQQKKARNLAELLSRSAGNYKIKDLGIYPGSLGNYAGNERIIPTITLEMSSSNPKFVKKFWNDFSPGLFKAIKYEFKKHQFADIGNSNTDNQ